MASSYNLFLFTLISLAFLSSNNLNPTAAKSPDLINSICSETLNAANCLEFLKPLYRPGESLLDLTKDSIKSGSKFPFLVYDEIRVREIRTIKNPALNKIFKKCGEEFTAATNALIQGQDIVKSGDYRKLTSIASTALSQAQSCDRNFTPANPEPSDFKTLAGKAQNVCTIVVALSKRLASGKS